MIEKLFAGRHHLPVILQSEQAECGLACLAMVASWYGRKIDLNVLRREYPASARGATLKGIMETAAALHMNSRALRLEIEDLGDLQLPAILHWDMTHYVVLEKVTRSGIVIHDPAVGRRKYSSREVGTHFTGIALELIPGVDFKPGTHIRRSRLGELFERYPGFHTAIGQLFILSLLLQLASIGSAFYMQLVIDEGIASQDADFLAVIAIGFLMLAATNVAMNWTRGKVQLYFSNQLGFQMVSNVFHHLLSLPLAYFEKRHVGDLVSRFGSIREIRRIITEDLITVVLDGIFALVTLVVLFWLNALLGCIVLGFVVVVTALKLLFIPHIKMLQEQKIVAEARMSSNLMENMRAIEVIKFYCRELPRIALWRNYYAEQINTNVMLTRFSINMEAVYGLLWGLENILVIYIAALFVLDGEMSLGFLTAFVALKGNFSDAIRSFIEKLVQIRLVRLQLERVSDITCTEKEFDTLAIPSVRRPVKGCLTLEAVSYAYPGSHSSVISGADCSIEPGEVVALLGASGSGKSTLIRIMAGLLEPDSGVVRIDGEDIRNFGVRQYRNACAGILQSDQLLSGSIIENITLFAHDVDHARVREAARMAKIDTFIDGLPMGFNSFIGDMGSIMSVGQGQRVLLARAFYKQPRVLFLDEATANLDAELEGGILGEVAGLNITTVLVTHRREPLSIADRLFVCEQGRLRELDRTAAAN